MKSSYESSIDDDVSTSFSRFRLGGDGSSSSRSETVAPSFGASPSKSSTETGQSTSKQLFAISTDAWKLDSTVSESFNAKPFSFAKDFSTIKFSRPQKSVATTSLQPTKANRAESGFAPSLLFSEGFSFERQDPCLFDEVIPRDTSILIFTYLSFPDVSKVISTSTRFKNTVDAALAGARILRLASVFGKDINGGHLHHDTKSYLSILKQYVAAATNINVIEPDFFSELESKDHVQIKIGEFLLGTYLKDVARRHPSSFIFALGGDRKRVKR